MPSVCVQREGDGEAKGWAEKSFSASIYQASRPCSLVASLCTKGNDGARRPSSEAGPSWPPCRFTWLTSFPLLPGPQPQHRPQPPEAGLDAFYLHPACPLLSAQMTPWHPSDLGSRLFLRIPVSFKSPRMQALRVPCSPPAYTRHCYNCAAV